MPSVVHPSEWCRIPSLWRHRGTGKYARALHIGDRGEGWFIRIKDETLKTREVDAVDFRKDYDYQDE